MKLTLGQLFCHSQIISTFRVLSLSEKISTTLFFLGETIICVNLWIFAYVFKKKGGVHGFIVKLVYTINDFDQQTL